MTAILDRLATRVMETEGRKAATSAVRMVVGRRSIRAMNGDRQRKGSGSDQIGGSDNTFKREVWRTIAMMRGSLKMIWRP